jgi:membrane protease YdiL (CAAX protease family)
VSLFLVVLGDSFQRLMTRYFYQLVQSKQIGRWTILVDYDETARALFFILESILIVAYLVLRRGANISVTSWFRRVPLRELVIGVVAAIPIFLLSLPALLRLDAHSGFVSLVTSQLFSTHTILVLILIVGVMPLTTECLYRGVVFQGLSKGATLPAAVVTSSFVFAATWPVYNPIVGILLGIASAVLFNRSKSILPGLLTNLLVTILCLLALVLAALK